MEQTNRTILFEEINPNVGSLLTYINDSENKESLTDETIKSIHEQLLVYSFEEAVERFRPSVHIQQDVSICFNSFDMPNVWKLKCTIPIYGETGILEKMLNILGKEKEKLYVVEDISEYWSTILFGQYYELFKQKRKEVFSLFCEGNKEQAKNELVQGIHYFDNGLCLLNIYIKEIQKLIQEPKAYQNDSLIIDNNKTAQIKLLAVAGASAERFPKCLPEQKESYSVYLEEVLSQYKDMDCNNLELVRELLLMPLEADSKTYSSMYEQILKIYSDIMKQFWRKAKPVLETMLGIYEFFAQYEVEPKKCFWGYRGIQNDIVIEEMRPSLLIANCKVDEAVLEENRHSLKLFFKTVNQKNYSDYRIWYAIIPGIEAEYLYQKQNIRERFKTDKKVELNDAVTTEGALLLADILTENEILCFFSLETNGEYGFERFSRNGYEPFNNSYLFLENGNRQEYLIPVYPNFELVSSSCMHYDVLIRKGENRRNWLGNIEIGAAYVGSGLIAACQCPKYLTKFYGDNVDTGVPGVAYNLVKDGNEYKTITTMKRELLYIDKDLFEQAVKYGRGMLFLPKGEVNVAATDRTFSYKEASKDTIAVIQTLSYLRGKIRYETQDYKEERIKEFFINRSGSIISNWKAKGKCVNGIIKKNENLKCSIDSKNKECTFTMEYEDSIRKNTVRIS